MEFRSVYTKYFGSAVATDVRISSTNETMSYTEKETILRKVLKALHSNVQASQTGMTASDNSWTTPYSRVDGSRRELVPILVVVEVERAQFKDNCSVPKQNFYGNESREIKDARDIIKNLKEINNKDKLLLL